jgi:hypothetical protein
MVWSGPTLYTEGGLRSGGIISLLLPDVNWLNLLDVGERSKLLNERDIWVLGVQVIKLVAKGLNNLALRPTAET